MQNVTAFKVFCLPLSTRKQEKLKLMINEYAIFYNHSAKMQPSLPDKYRDKPKKGEVGLYGKYVSSGIIPRLHIGAGEAYIAVMDACANWKTSKILCDNPKISIMKDPNIIKFNGSNYKILKVNDHFGIQLKFKNAPIYFPLKTGKYEELNKYLELNVGKDVGEITYNLKANSISIPRKIQSEKFKSTKKNEIKTFIGVDLGINNIAVLSAISVDTKEIKKITTQLYKNGVKNIAMKDIPGKVLKVKVLSGFENKYKMVQLKRLENKRRKNRNEVGHGRENLRNRTNHYISSEIVKFASKFDSPIVIFEKGLANLVRGKNSTWSPADVKSKTEYKLKSRGIWISEVYPHHTSQICNHCGAIGTRLRGMVYFSCSSCGLGAGSNPTSTIGQYNADVNGSINIALRGIYILTRRGKLSDIDTVSLKRPNVPLSDIAQEAKTPGIREAIDRKNSSRKDEACSRSFGIVNAETISRSTQYISEQCNGKTHQVDCVPEKRFSSSYRGEYNLSVRTEFDKKTDIGEVLSKSEF